MNQINHAINGLASSLLLNVGLTRAAEMLDPVQGTHAKVGAATENCTWVCNFSAENCTWVCNFAAESGK